MTTLRLPFEQLVRHEQFVRQALRGLLRDPGAIDDALQETWLRAWQSPPPGEGMTRTWLARTARNLAIGRWRSERRRARREQRVAASAAGDVESAAASQQRVELCQRVVAAILALDEPYRGVVLMRYEQGLDIAAIAGRCGRSAATVRSQLSRAHDQLRERLASEYGGRERWAALATSFVGSAVAPRTVALGAVPALAAAAAIAVAAWLAWPMTEPSPPQLASGAASLPAAAATATPAIARNSTDSVRVASDAPQERSSAPMLRAPAELFDRSYYDDYELATFSFEHGLRDDLDLRVTRNDWEIQLANSMFSVNMVTDDRSRIADLGPMAPAAFGAADLQALAAIDRVSVRVGHAYFIGTRDRDTTLATVIFVRAFEPSRRCCFDWFTTDGTGRWQGSVADPGTGRPWVDELVRLYQQQLVAQNVRALQRPMVWLQLRGGAGGGNPRHLDVAGEDNGRVDVRATAPIDVATPATTQEQCQAYAEAGTVPVGSTFVVTRIDYRGGNPGDSNGSGGFRIVVAGDAVVDLPPSSEPIAGTWTGRLVVKNGEEGRTRFEIRNSSWGEVVFYGVFEHGVDAPGFGGKNAGFGRVPVVAPEVTRLAVPAIRLQLHTGPRSGSSCRLDLRVRSNRDIDRFAKAPIDSSAQLPDGVDCLAFGEGGPIPAGCTFVVTAIRYDARNRNGERALLRVVVAGKEVVRTMEPGAAPQGLAEGHYEIVAGEETRTFVEVGSDCWIDVVLTGRFEFR
jgi:RNA polymerase sigma factor (sigma-70 family)